MSWPVVNGTVRQLNYVDPLGPVHVQSGIAGESHVAAAGYLNVRVDVASTHSPIPASLGACAGVDGHDPFDVPQAPWERMRDATFTPCYSRLTIHNDSHATVTQLWAANGTAGDTFTVVQRRHGPFA